MIVTLTDEKWALFEKIFETPRFGRPRKWSDRQILEVIIYMLRNGCVWACLPKEFPPKSTVHDRFCYWCRKNYFQEIRNILIELISENIQDISVAYVDATFIRGCLGGDKIGKTKCGKGSKAMVIVNEASQPIAVVVTSAQPHEIKLLDEVLENLPDIPLPKVLVGDKAYDDDKTDSKMKKKGVNMVAPHKKNRKAPATQNEQILKDLYPKRWKVERFFAWTKYARRILNRFEKKSILFQAFFDLFSALTLMNFISQFTV